jgi:hypothetical protein
MEVPRRFTEVLGICYAQSSVPMKNGAWRLVTIPRYSDVSVNKAIYTLFNKIISDTFHSVVVYVDFLCTHMASLVFFGKLGVTLKVGQLGCSHTHGAGAPLVACLGPNLVRSVYTTSPKAVHKVLARFNAPKHRFALSMRRGSTFQGTPSSLPIKGGPLPPT